MTEKLNADTRHDLLTPLIEAGWVHDPERGWPGNSNWVSRTRSSSSMATTYAAARCVTVGI